MADEREDTTTAVGTTRIDLATLEYKKLVIAWEAYHAQMQAMRDDDFMSPWAHKLHQGNKWFLHKLALAITKKSIRDW